MGESWQCGKNPFLLLLLSVLLRINVAATMPQLYTGQHLVSNMVIAQIKMLSGYIPVKSSVKKLEKLGQIQKSEVNINHVLLYLNEVHNTSQTFSFTEQETPVQDLKPALVKVYDYYETGEFATAKYTAPCSTDDIKE